MPNVFATIGTAWDFYRSQPIMNMILFWLLVLPLAGLVGLADQRTSNAMLREATPQFMQSGAGDIGLFVLLLCFEVMLSIVTLWGAACALLMGQKLITSKAGRTRSSFKAVRKEASAFVANMFLTDILRSCFAFFWGLLLIVPGIIYFVRTFFFYIAIVCEGKAYRGALEYSKELVKGRTLDVMLYIIGLFLALFVPAVMIDGSIYLLIEAFDTRLLPITYLFSGLCYGLATLVFVLSSQVYYAALKKA